MRKETKWTKYGLTRRNFSLGAEERKSIEEKIRSVKLGEEPLRRINAAIDENKISDYKGRSGNRIKASKLIRYLYIMRYILELPSIQIASYLGISDKTLNYKMLQLGWQYTKKESQKIAASMSRNYSEILLKGRESRLKNTIDKGVLDGSVVENSIRSILNERLTREISDASVIVGVSNRSILAPKEVDIPVIILRGSEVFKFCVEVNGDYFHTKEKDDNKNKLLESIGFKCFYITLTSSTLKQKELYGDIDSQIQSICASIAGLMEVNVK